MIASRQTQPRRSRLFPEMYKPKPWWQAGMVELKFRENVRPQVVERSGQEAPRVESLNGVDLEEFHELAKKWNVRHIRHTVKMSYEEADRLQEAGRKQGRQAAHLSHFVTLHLDRNAPVENIAAEFGKLECIEHAGLAPAVSGSAPPLNDRFLGEDDVVRDIPPLENQWYIFRCHADKAWPDATGQGVTGNGVTITVIDTGFDAEHEDLKPNVDTVFNSTTNNDQILTRSSGTAKQLNHGTGSAGLAAAAGNNNVGIAGFAFNAKLRLVQATRDANSNDPTLPANNVPDAIKWATDQVPSGRQVITISLGVGNGYDQIPIDAFSGSGASLGARERIDIAIAHNIVVCISAGNSSNALGQDLSTDQKGVPFTPSNAIVVGATRKNQQGQDVPSNSNWGPRMTVCAPGDPNHDMTCSSKPDLYTNQYGGASGATPKVAGTVALMLEANDKLTPAQVEAILNRTGKPLQTKLYASPFGPMLDTFAAVTAAKVPPSGPRLIAKRFLNFGKVDRGNTSPAQRVSLFNIGADTLNLGQVQPKPGSSGDFKIKLQSGVPGPVPSGGRAVIDIDFTPSSHDDVDATFLVPSDDPNSPLEIQCTGTAPWTLLGKLELAGGIVAGAAGIIALVLYIAGRRNKS